MKDFNEVCTEIETIVDVGECKTTVSALKKSDPGISFAWTKESSNWPNGCYKKDNKVYFNTHISATANVNGRPICKTKTIARKRINSNITISNNTQKGIKMVVLVVLSTKYQNEINRPIKLLT